MTANWDSIQQEITRILLGDPQEGTTGLPQLEEWRKQASWVRLLGDRRIRHEDLEAAESPPVLALTPILATLWRLGTVVVVTARWDGCEFHFHIGRANSSRFGAESLQGAFPPDFRDELVVAASDPLNAVHACGQRAMKLTGRPLSCQVLGMQAPFEAMVGATGGDPVAFLGLLSPVGKEEAVASTLDLQKRLREHVNPGQMLETDLAAQSLVRMITDEVDYRLGRLGIGLWKHHGFLIAGNEDVLHRAAGAVISTQAGQPEGTGPVLDWGDTAPGRPDPGSPVWVCSEDAAGLYACPTRPLPGFAIEASCQFDVPRNIDPVGRQFVLGNIRAHGTVARPLPVSLDELKRHLLICGVTGSGKTQTSFHILQRLWLDHKVPWLVIEPIKGDYWKLARSQVEESEKEALKAIRVLTLGDASPGRSNPISLNPFVFPEEILLSTHLDLLKSVFFAGFVLYPPMPYVLETALVRTYEKKGWDLITSDWGGGSRENRFPTLTDFIACVDEVVRGLGWANEMKDNIRTSLMVRLENLRRGGKGLFLDGPSTWTIDRILDRPTILELSVFGSDEEKSFVSGLIFGLLAEWREAEARRSLPEEGLRHVVVIEEAHRLFRRTNTDQGAEGGNVRGQAVERISGLLTEIRSYGQGVIIIDQSPEKLAPDAVRNTGTKIIHRIVAAEDRDTVARAASLSSAQERELVVLPPGQAVLAAENIREPVLLSMPLTRFVSQRPEDRISLLMSDARKTESFEGTAAPFGISCRGCRAVAEGRCGAVRAQVRRLLTGRKGRRETIPSFWLLSSGGKKMSLGDAISISVEKTSTESGAAHLQCAAAQMAPELLPMLLERQPALAGKAGTLKGLIETTFVSAGELSEQSCRAFQGGEFRFSRCSEWCSSPCLFGGALLSMPKLSPGLRQAARGEMTTPSAEPDRIMSRLMEEVEESVGFPDSTPRAVGVCALMVLAGDLEGTIENKKQFVNLVMKAWLKGAGGGSS